MFEILKLLKELLIFVLFIIVCFIIYNKFFRYIYYYIVPSHTNPEFENETENILKTSNINKTHKILRVYNRNSADIVIELRSRSSLDDEHSEKEYYPGTKKQIRFSFTWQHPKPYIAIDDHNWTFGVPESNLSVADYRKYVIRHEFMHALGYDHIPCNTKTAKNGVCPVLYQATRGPPSGFIAGTDVSNEDYSNKIKGSYF